MKKFLLSAVAVAVLAASVPALAGSSKPSKPSKPNTSCVIGFSKAFPKALLEVTKIADPTSIRIKYYVDASNLKYAAEICFDIKKDCKYGSYRLKGGCCYCIEVRCGWVGRPYECEREGKPS